MRAEPRLHPRQRPAPEADRLERALGDRERALGYLREVLPPHQQEFVQIMRPHAVWIARCVLHLRHVLLEDGLPAWFMVPRTELDGRSPIQAMRAGEGQLAVELARHTYAQARR